MPAITNVNELQNIENDLAGNYWLANDIDASGFGFVPLAQVATFTGVLDGRNHTITDLSVTVNGVGYQYGGLFRRNDGLVKNLTIETIINVTSSNSTARAGGVAADNELNGIIQNCHSVVNIITDGIYSEVGGLVSHNEGIISSKSSARGTVVANGSWTYAGGLVCFNYGIISRSSPNVEATAAGSSGSYSGGFVQENNGEISCCYSVGNSISSGGSARAAGFCYDNYGLISNSYSRGNASAPSGTSRRASGFIIYNETDATIFHSYSTGKPTASNIYGFAYSNDGTIDNCFWDIQTSETEVSDGGIGQTTSQMKTKSTFTDADWDFIIIWFIHKLLNDGYPCFFAMPPDSPRRTVAIIDKITLESIRNIEMVAMGRFRVDKEGNAVYRSRYARNP